MKVSEREISRQMKVSKTAESNTIKNLKKNFLRTAKEQAVREFLAVKINFLLSESIF